VKVAIICIRVLLRDLTAVTEENHKKAHATESVSRLDANQLLPLLPAVYPTQVIYIRSVSPQISLVFQMEFKFTSSELCALQVLLQTFVAD
jgi:hypothetical protein